MKRTAAKQYKSTYDSILRHLLGGQLLHVDETQVSIKGSIAYVWVFTNLHDVFYLYTETRGGSFLQEMLRDFKGVLVSDFFAAYDGRRDTPTLTIRTGTLVRYGGQRI